MPEISSKQSPKAALQKSAALQNIAKYVIGFVIF